MRGSNAWCDELLYGRRCILYVGDLQAHGQCTVQYKLLNEVLYLVIIGGVKCQEREAGFVWMGINSVDRLDHSSK